MERTRKKVATDHSGTVPLPHQEKVEFTVQTAVHEICCQKWSSIVVEDSLTLFVVVGIADRDIHYTSVQQVT